MSYVIAQDQHYAGNDFWKWSAWIEADASELDQIEYVEWILHPSFKRPRVKSKDRARAFVLETAGWGTFRLRAEIKLKSTELVKLHHDLVLDYPAESASSQRGLGSLAPSSLPSVFLSYGSADTRFAASVKARLSDYGAHVLDASEIVAGESWKSATEKMIRQADVVIGLVGTDEASPWVVGELSAAQASAKPVLALVMNGNSDTGLPNAIPTFALESDQIDIGKIVDRIRGQDGKW